jgi:NADPH:quinone reductase-like Zn-dependent oxidoreductase
VSDVDLVFDLDSGDTQDRSWGVLKEGGILVSTLGQPQPRKQPSTMSKPQVIEPSRTWRS